MGLSTINDRIAEINERQMELSAMRKEMAVQMAVEVGTDDEAGVHIDPLTAWARRIKKVNSEMRDLADERRVLRNTKREKNTSACTCSCH